jgi:hypothetical protein
MHRSGSRRTRAWLVIAAGLLALVVYQRQRGVSPPPPAPESPFRDRRAFAEKLAWVPDGATKQEVEKKLGKPDDVLSGAGTRYTTADKIWCYGTAGHGSLPTLGQVLFIKGRVSREVGGHPALVVDKSMDEAALRAAMRFLHPVPRGEGNNDPLHLIRVVNYLQPLGKQKALAVIREYIRVTGADPILLSWLVQLLHTLFDPPKPPGYLKEVYTGLPVAPGNRTLIPRFPIVIKGDVPFSLVYSGAPIGGTVAGLEYHVDYIRKQCQIRSLPLRPPDDPYASFKKLLASAEWAALAASEKDPKRMREYEAHTRIQVLALCRTAYDPPGARNPFAVVIPADFGRYHQAFLKTGAQWDERLQMYVRGDGSHEEVGALAARY